MEDLHLLIMQFSLNEDAKRRDFTINSLYLDPQGNLIDLVNGKHDIN